MDDFNVNALNESKNEWSARLINILTPLVIDGYKSILEEAVKLCKENGEYDKYLMTFQNFISRVPKWNPDIIEKERITGYEHRAPNKKTKIKKEYIHDNNHGGLCLIKLDK